MGYTRQDNQPLFRAATGPQHCARTATASPVNLLMHCTKWIPHGLGDSHEPHKALSAVSPFTWGIWTLLLFHSVSFVDPPEASVTSHHHQHVSELPKPHRSLSSGGGRLILSPPRLLHRLLDFQLRADAARWRAVLGGTTTAARYSSNTTMQWSVKVSEDVNTLSVVRLKRWWAPCHDNIFSVYLVVYLRRLISFQQYSNTETCNLTRGNAALHLVSCRLKLAGESEEGSQQAWLNIMWTTH